MASLEDLDEKTRNQLAFAQKILGDTKLSNKVRRMVREADPNFNAPDLDLEDKIKIEVEARDKKIEELRLQLETAQRNDNWKAEQQKMRDAGYEVQFIEDLMKKEQIASVDTAIAHANMQAQLAPSTPSNLASDVLPPSKDDMKKLWENPGKWREQVLRTAVGELRGSKQPGR
jgi:hypothetical protein